MKFLSIFLTLMLLIGASHARIDANYDPFNKQENDPEVVSIPLSKGMIKSFLEDMVKDPSVPLTKLYRFEIDPVHRAFIIDGEIEMPASLLLQLYDVAGGEKFKKKQNFSIGFKFPDAMTLRRSNYFKVDFFKFELGGQSYLEAMPVLGSFGAALLANTTFTNYMSDVVPGNEETKELEKINNIVAEQIKSKAIRFGERSIAFKLDTSVVADFKNNPKAASATVWAFQPAVESFGGKEYEVLEIIVGLGKPKIDWVKGQVAKYKKDEERYMVARDGIYRERMDIERFIADELKPHFEKEVIRIGVIPKNNREQRIFDRFLTKVRSQARNILTLENEAFAADPRGTYVIFRQDMESYATSYLTELKRQQNIDFSASKDAIAGSSEWPFLEKRISGNLLQKAGAFFRDFEFEGDMLFEDINIVIDPALPGLRMEGMVNLDLNYLMDAGLEAEEINWGKVPYRAAKSQWGAGIPFSAGIRLKMFKDSWLGIDVIDLSIFEGSQKTAISKYQAHGSELDTFTKMAIANVLKDYLLEQEEIANIEEIENREEGYEYKKIVEGIKNQKEAYKNIDFSRYDSLFELTTLNIRKNPYALGTGVEYVTGKAEAFFKNIVKYSEEHDMLMMKVDPKVVSKTILATENNVGVWNLEPLFDERLNNTFLEITVGNGVRSEAYNNHLQTRREREESDNFVQFDESKKSAPTDLFIKANLESLKGFVNQILADAAELQVKEVEEKMASTNEEMSEWTFSLIELKSKKDDVLTLEATIEQRKKSKKMFSFFSKDKFNVSRKTMTVGVDLGITVKSIKPYLDDMKLKDNEIFLGDQVLVLDLIDASYEVIDGKASLLDSIIEFSFKGKTINGAVSGKIKTLLMKFAGMFLHSKGKENGNVKLGNVHLNQFAKIFTHKKELLLQLNPKMASIAFEIALVKNQEFNGKKLGLNISKKDQSLSVDLAVKAAMADIDKNKILRAMKRTVDEFNKFLKVSDRDQLTKLATVDGTFLYDIIYNDSSEAKKSSFHEMTSAINKYDEVAEVIRSTHAYERFTFLQEAKDRLGITLDEVKEKVLRIQEMQEAGTRNLGEAEYQEYLKLKEELNIPAYYFDAEPSKLKRHDRYLSSTGVEVMYFLSFAVLLEKKALQLSTHLRKHLDESANPSLINNLERKAEEINFRFIQPLKSLYKERFEKFSLKLEEKGPTDWNMGFYPDAQFNVETFKRIEVFTK